MSSSEVSSGSLSSSGSGSDSSYGDGGSSSNAASSSSGYGSASNSGSDSYSSSASSVIEHEVPFEEQVQLSFQNLSYAIEDKKAGVTKQILDNVSGYAAPGSLTAIIGPSGAGKTSLIRILARTLGAGLGHVDGKMTVNNSEVGDSDFSRLTAFVAQDDVLMGSATVRESFDFAGELQLPHNWSRAERKARVDSVISTLGLDKCQHTICGYTGPAAANSGLKRGISGGERKRTSIGLELITNPRLLFLDEPTSGLDSYAAKSVMLHLAKLARSGRTIVCTIHQPSNQIFRLFDNLIVLAEGRTLYNGPARDAVPFFAEQGFKCPPFRNPADYFMRSLFTGVKEDIEANQQRLELVDPEQVNVFANYYDESDYREEAESPPKAPPKLKSASQVNAHRAPLWVRFWLVFMRSMRNNLREPLLLNARIAQSIFLGLVSGFVYWNVGTDQAGIQDRLGGLFFLAVVIAFNAVNGPLFVFPAERAVYYRENSAGMYSTSMYFLAKLFADVPINIFLPVLFAAICYYMIGLATSFERFATFCGVVILMTQVAYALGLFITTGIKNQAVAIQVQPILMLPMMLLSGFYLNSDSVPVYLIWIEAISFIKYGFHAVAINEFTDATFHCTTTELARTNGTCPLTTGSAVISQYGMTDLNVAENCYVLIGLWAGLNLCSYAFLRFSRKE